MIFLKSKKFNSLLLAICLVFSCQIKISFAQESENVNPLTTNFSHELVPAVRRNLTIREKETIEAKIIDLDQMAMGALSSGNEDQALDFWYEAINLSRFLDLDSELEIISKVGTIAWDKRRREDLSFLQERLLVLESQNSNKNEIKKEFLPQFIKAYDSIHYLDKSIALHTQNLSLVRENDDAILITETLDKLGELYLAKFDYYQAEPIYKQLLETARNNQDYLLESRYLQKLAPISQALVNPKNSVEYKEDLAQNYQKNNNLSALSRLKISIGNDYKALDNAESASKYYQDAFTLALSLEQYAIAGDALKQLGKLYQQYQELDSALKIYQELIKIEKNSYDFYGLMNTYDFIGTIYSQKQDYGQALNSFRKALAIANELEYKQDYFRQKIDQLNSLDL